MKKNKLIWVVIALILSCEGKAPEYSNTEQSEYVPSSGSLLEGLPPELETLKLELEPRAYRGGQTLSIPRSLQDEPFTVRELVIPPEAHEYGVVAYRQAKLYPDIFGPQRNQVLRSVEEPELEFIRGNPLANLPMGTVLPLMEKIVNPDPPKELYSDGFPFEDQVNYFYRTEYMGQKGIVFGADLEGANAGGSYYTNMDRSQATAMGYYYARPSVEKEFSPVWSLSVLDSQLVEKLKNDRLAFSKNTAGEMNEWIGEPEYILDDFLSYYQAAALQKNARVFYSTDVFVHTLHKLFDKALSQIESHVLLPLTKGLIAGLQEKIRPSIGLDSPTGKAALLAWQYLKVAEFLAVLAPDLNTGVEENQTAEPDWKTELQGYLAREDLGVEESQSQLLAEEIGLVMGAGGPAESALFGYTEDYTQYNPRGHYTESARLKAYFRTMMYLSRLNFFLETSTPAAAEQTLKHGPSALLLAKTILADAELSNLWGRVFDPISFLIGESDDITLRTLRAAEPNLENLDLDAVLADGGLAYFSALSSKLPAPKIQGMSVYNNSAAAPDPSQGDGLGEQPKGWRLFGQRFVPDSFWMDMLTFAVQPTQEPGNYRPMPEGLDVAAVLGSDLAFRLQEPERAGFPTYARLFPQVREEYKNRNTETWNRTFYNRYLDIVGSMLEFGKDPGLYYTTSPLWEIRSLQSGLGAWAELRHDTLLYSKSSNSENGSGGDGLTWRTEPPPKEVPLVEPNLPFFYRMSETVKTLLEGLQRHRVLTEEALGRFSLFYSILNKVTAIVEIQARNVRLGDEDYAYFRNLPRNLWRCIVPYGNWVADPDKFKIAVIADVHTDNDAGQALEVGIGKPVEMWVAVNDGWAGKRIMVGYVFSYYEFAQPMNDRLTDEKWRAFIYSDASREEHERRRPEWLRGTMP